MGHFLIQLIISGASCLKLVSANSGLKFNPFFYLLCFYTTVQTSGTKTAIDLDKISKEIFPIAGEFPLNFMLT